MSKTTSSPVKAGSKSVGADNYCDVRGPSQKDLKHDVGVELKGCTWKFSAEELAHALAKKIRKTPYVLGTIDTIDDYDLTEHKTIMDEKLEDALKKFEESKPGEILKNLEGKGEREQYNGFRDLAIHGIQSCRTVLGDKAGSYYASLTVVVHDTPMQDAVGGADALKPDLAGVNSFPMQSNTKCAKDKNDGEPAQANPEGTVLGEATEDVGAAKARKGSGTKRKAEDNLESAPDQQVGSAKVELFWRPPNGRERDALLIPFEVKRDSWPDLIRQAGTYARAMFAAHPYRLFALAIGYKYDTQELAFLVFHRGGLTGCKPLKLTTRTGRREMLRLFLTILTWDSPADAGIPEWTDGWTILLPSGPEGETSRSFQIEELLHSTNCIVGRASWVARFIAWGLLSPDALHNSVTVDHAIPASSTSTLSEVRSSIDPPSSKRLRKTVAEPQGKTQRKRSGKPLEIPKSQSDQHLRRVSHAIIAPDKDSIDYPDRDLVVKMAWHSKDRYDVEARVLNDCGGEFGIPNHYCTYHIYLKDGIPLTNHLFLPPPKPRTNTDEDEDEDDMNTLKRYYWKISTDQKEPQKPDRRSAITTVMEYRGYSLVRASTPWEFVESLLHGALGWYNLCQKGYLHRDISIRNVLMSSTGIGRKAQPMKVESDGNQQNDLLRDRLKSALEKLEIRDRCKGDTIDVGFAMNWNIQFSYAHVGTRSGTLQFMSDQLLYSWEYKEPYLHSPVDDLFSFFYVAEWAAVFNNSRFSERSPAPDKLLDLRQKICGNGQERRSGRDLIVNDPTKAFLRKDYGSFLNDCHPFLFTWYRSMMSLDISWRGVYEEILTSTMSAETPRDAYVPLFQQYALEGITQLAECVLACRDELHKSSSQTVVL